MGEVVIPDEADSLDARLRAMGVTAAVGVMVGLTVVGVLGWSWNLVGRFGFMAGVGGVLLLWLTPWGRRFWHWLEQRDAQQGRRALFHAAGAACGLVSQDKGLTVTSIEIVPGGWIATVEVPGGLTVAQVVARADTLAVALRVRSVRVEPTAYAHRCCVVVMNNDPLERSIEWRPVFGYFGETLNGPAVWEPDAFPHLLVVGPTGSGKTTALLSLLASLAQNPAAQFVLVDVKRTAFGRFRGGSRAQVETTHEEAALLLGEAHSEMMRRLQLMELTRVDDYRSLRGVDVVGPLFVVVDEVASLLADNLPGEDVKMGKDRARSLAALLHNVARLGRSPGVHLVLGVQRPDASILTGEARDNLTARLALGPLSSDGRAMVFGPEWRGIEMPGIRGRGFWQGQGGDPLTPLPVSVAMCDLPQVNAALGLFE